MIYLLLSFHISLNAQIGANSSDSIKINKYGKSISTRILVPMGFVRDKVNEKSFEEYLRNLPLKAQGTYSEFYNGDLKESDGVYIAVVDQKIGKRDLHQCADAVMRLRGEYLWKNKMYNKIHFNFTNGFNVDYKTWMKGYRISVRGNNVEWIKKTDPSNSFQTFWKYMEIIFSYAGTLSLEKEMMPINIDNMKIGDVFIQGGSPGHAVIVVDIAKNYKSGERIFLLAQSYMPAQQTQILINPNNSKLSPWYSINFRDNLITPEWTFKSEDLHRFNE